MFIFNTFPQYASSIVSRRQLINITQVFAANKEVINLLLILIIITIFQTIAISPIKSMGFSNLDLIIFTPGFLMVTSGMAYYSSSMLNYEPSKNLTYSLVVVLITQFLIFYFLTGKIQKKFLNSPTLRTKAFKDQKRIIIIFACLVTITLVILNSDQTINYLITFNKVVEDLRENRQLLFTYTYSLEGTGGAKIGMFYPWGGSFIPSLIVTHLTVPTQIVNVIFITFISIFAFYTQIYILSKNLEIPFRSTSFFLLTSMTLFPIHYIFQLPFSVTYGIVGAITLVNVYLIYNLYFNKILKLLLIGLFSLILLPLHPSSILTFGILLIAIRLLFLNQISQEEIRKLTLNKKSLFVIFFVIIFSFFNLIKKSDFLLVLNGTLVPFLLRQPSQNFLTVKVNSVLTTNPAANSSQSFEQFLQEKSLLNRIIGYLWQNVFTLSLYTYSIPVFFVIFFIIIYSIKMYNKKLSYLIPITLYFLLIMSASVSGIGNGVSIISVITIPFYQSPIRITHLGVLIYFLYFARYIKDKNIVQNK